jgi:hypothetical protein
MKELIGIGRGHGGHLNSCDDGLMQPVVNGMIIEP